MTKKWYRSKTLWTNTIGFVAIISSAIFAREDIAQQIIALEATVLTIINIILRFITKEGLSK